MAPAPVKGALSPVKKTRSSLRSGPPLSYVSLASLVPLPRASISSFVTTELA